MNVETFVSVFAALVAYRVVSPLLDKLNPLNRARSAAVGHVHSAQGASKAG